MPIQYFQEFTMQPLSSQIRAPASMPDIVQLEGYDPNSQPAMFDVQRARTAARNDWVSRYVSEWSRLANGRMDDEIANTEGTALHHVVGHRPPEEVARQHFNSCTGAADTLTSAATKFRVLAADVGLIAEGAELSTAQLEFAQGVAELCAAVGDQVRTARDGSAGDLIRANYGPVPF
jgi:hypothetical protein